MAKKLTKALVHLVHAQLVQLTLTLDYRIYYIL